MSLLNRIILSNLPTFIESKVDMIEQKVSGKYIELYKLLKLANLVASGGEAKMVIEDLMVSVNGVIETRKRNKLKNGDIVSFAGEEIRVNAET